MHREDVIGIARRVGVVFLDPQVGLVVQQAIEHVGRVAHTDVHDLGVERPPWAAPVAPLRLELGQVGGRHLAALAGDLEQPVLVNQAFDAGRSSACHALRRSMCSSMCREFGLAGDRRNRASQVVLPLSRLEAMAMHFRQRLGQQLDDLPVVAHRERLEANTVCSSTRCSRRACSLCPYSSQLSAPTLS